MFNYIYERTGELLKSRVFVLSLIIFSLFSMLIAQCFQLQIINGESYQEQYTLLIQKTKEVKGTRGNIYDRNGVLLAYNELAYAVTIEDNGDYSSVSEKNTILNSVINEVIEIVESNDDSVISSFKIVLDTNDEYTFTNAAGTSRDRFIADVYGESYISDLSEEQLNSSAEDIIRYLCTDSRYGYGIELSTNPSDKENILKMINIRYAMSLNSYRKYISTTVAENVSDKTVAAIMENSTILQGVTIEEDSLRRYVDSMYFAPILGYTGAISQEEYESYMESGLDTYTLNDTVGKSGIEKEMDSYLQGTKGEEKIYVNSVGKVTDTISTTPAVVGNDVYLTIDSELQKVAYDLLEETLAGILESKIINTLTTEKETSENIMIPIGDVYSSFIENSIIDMSIIDSENASDIEKKVYKDFADEKASIIEDVVAYITNPDASSRTSLTTNFRTYVTYVTAELLRSESKIIVNSKVDTTDETYKKWAITDTINAYDYLNYLISKNWIDPLPLTNYLDDESTYADSDEIFDGIIRYVEDNLSSSNAFDILIYKNMVASGKITGKDICLIAFEQGIFSKKTDEYDKFLNGGISSYDLVMGKIRNLEITPGQLGLEPCSGSVVLTDPDNGDVLALVSYPGYDTNRLANTMDSDYYNKLLNDLSSPFYNHATQEKTAPGSTYKMITLAAGLGEGVINTGTSIYCSGIYEKVTPNPKCWIHPNGHGGETASTALRDSCNIYFYEVGYRLSLTNRGLIGTDDKLGSSTLSSYSSNLGISTLSVYTSLFGLGEKSGVEIPESEPEISNSASVPSSIGQGNHNYTTSQLARYVATVANKGVLYDLTLLDRVEDIEANIIKEYDNEIKSELAQVDNTSWNSIHSGMTQMVKKSGVFKTLASDVSLAGKTGTAQQSLNNPNHALFVGFTPVENPSLAMAIRITNGYNSAYAAQIGRDITNYYSGASTRDEILSGKAVTLGTAIAGD